MIHVRLYYSSIPTAVLLDCLVQYKGLLSNAGNLNLESRDNGDAYFAVTRDGSRLTVSGIGKVSQFGNGTAFGVVARGFSEILLDGQVDVTDDGNDDSVLIDARDDSRVVGRGFGAVRDFGNGDSVAIRATGRSAVDFSGNYLMEEHGNGDIVFVSASGESRVRLTGSLVARHRENPYTSRSRIVLMDESRLEFVGGQLSSDYEWSNGTIRSDATVLQLSGSAVMHWSGGEFATSASGLQTVPFFDLSESSSLFIVGAAIGRRPGPIEELSGRISGILAHGSPFVFDFRRSADARIILVPEPATLGCLLMALMLGIPLRKHKFEVAIS